MLTAQYGYAVVLTRYVEHVEMLVGLDQCVDYLHRRGWVYVAIHLANDNQRLAFQTVGVVHVRGFGVLRSQRPAHPLLVPPDLVHAVIVAAAVSHYHLVKLRVE